MIDVDYLSYSKSAKDHIKCKEKMALFFTITTQKSLLHIQNLTSSKYVNVCLQMIRKEESINFFHYTA